MKYTLELTEKQAEIIKIALEEYFRLRMNQWFDFATELAMIGRGKEVDVSPGKFEEYINRRNRSKEMYEAAYRVSQPGLHLKTEEMMIAEDIWQVIRHKLYLDRGGDPNSYVVDARKPMKMSDEPPPKMGVIGDEKS